MTFSIASGVVIECPGCGTRYQLPADALGTRGRKVSCAHCGGTWQATAGQPSVDAAPLDAEGEAALDAAFAAEARRAGESTPRDEDEARRRTTSEIRTATEHGLPSGAEPQPDAADERTRRKAFDRRQAALSRQFPLARARRVIRLGSVTVLVVLIVCAAVFRTQVVRLFPDLAGAYEGIGLGVNVVGLEFRDVATLVTLRGGESVMQVDGRIFSVAAQSVPVPPVIVTLLDAGGTSLYEWSVSPAVHDLEPGEVLDFSAQLTSPPQATARLRLTFTDGRPRAEVPPASAALAES
jgi:predicted Zn finger-like uncharacterized protein